MMVKTTMASKKVSPRRDLRVNTNVWLSSGRGMSSSGGQS